MTKSRGIQSPRRPWTAVEIELLRWGYADSLTSDLAIALNRPANHVYCKATKLGLKKSAEFQATGKGGRILRGGKLSVATQFKPGQVPVNKGKKMPAGWAPGRMADTQFKPGQRPKTWVPVGSYRVNADGYLDRKVNDDPGPASVRWKPVHRLVWEEVNGPVPAGHAVVFRPGRKTTELDKITLDAVELVTRAELLARNSVHRYGPEISKLIQLRGALARQINRKSKEQDS